MAQIGDQADRLRVSTGDGKYEVVQEASGALYANRHGERWRDLTGDNLVGSLAHDLEEARDRIAELEEKLRAAEPESSLAMTP